MKDYVTSDRLVGVVNKTEFEFLAPLICGDGVVAISIINPEGVTPVNFDLLKHFDDVLQTSFWDLEEPIGRLSIISDEEAFEIFNFINKNKDKRFLIHCMAGESRSAGVARAVECICDFDSDLYLYATSSTALKEHPRYSANLVVFDKIVSNIKKD